LYAGAPITLTATTQLRATPFIGGAPGGRASTAIFIARDFDATSTLPLVILDGYGKGPSTNKNLDMDAAVMIWEPAGGSASLTSLPTVAAKSIYHLRGQSSASFPQKPYKIEFRDNGDNDMKLPVLGMPAEADWALIAPYYDRALIRNPFVYGLGRDMGMPAEALPGAWLGMRDVEMNPGTALSGKHKTLISLAVASQIPCRFCVIADTEFARLEGASDKEINEAVAMAGISRNLLTLLEGMGVDDRTVRRDADRLNNPNRPSKRVAAR
jgi:AhpD family alkylhydroperoxidase